MLTSIKWLNRHLDPGDVSPGEADDVLTHAGFPIEGEQQVGDDTCLDVELTSNRGDCLCHYGLAREVAAATGRRLTLPPVNAKIAEDSVERHAALENRVPELCPRFTARLIRGVSVGPSPAWLVELLQAIGQHSINNVVDVSNFILWELGHPNHVFDFNKLRGGRLIIRGAEAGEKLVTLDEAERTLKQGELVVADAERAVSLAGVIGGLETGVTDSTTDVLLEMATWDPVTIRNVARRLGIATDAGYRFERYVDARDLEWASERCAAMIAEVCGGEVLSGVLDEGAALPPRTHVELRPERCRRLLGERIETGDMARHLRAIGAEVEADSDTEVLRCTIPHHRHDLTREVDLIEEVARVHGYEGIEVADRVEIQLDLPHPPEWAERERAKEVIGRVLTGLGFFETVTFSFLPESEALAFLPAGLRALKVDEERRKGSPYLRPSVIPSLLTCRRANQDARVDVEGGVRLFEIASVFAEIDDGDQFRRQTVEHRNVAMLLDVPETPGLKSGERQQQGLRILRGAVESVARALGGPETIISFDAVDESDRGPIFPILTGETMAGVLFNGDHAGYAALITGEGLRRWGLDQPVVVAEVNLQKLIDLYPPRSLAHELPRFPGIDRDLSMVVQETTPWDAFERTIRSLDLDLLEDVSFVGCFRGKQVGAGRKSVTLRMHFRHPDRTLRHEEVDPQVERVIGALGEHLGAQVRAGEAVGAATG